MCHERSLERDDSVAFVERLLHFRRDPENFGHTGTAPSDEGPLTAGVTGIEAGTLPRLGALWPVKQ